ncbi:MAG: GHMP kinase, partial [Armatimonadota bacterium]
MQERVDADFAVWEAGRQRSASDWFAAGSVSVARAPGRLDVMGGIADYSGSLVAEMPIADAAVCGAQPDPTGTVAVRTLIPGEGIAAEVVFPAECFVNPVTLLRHLRDADPADRWAGYAAGTVAILRAEGEIRRGMGARLLLRSDVPVGAGVSSSAALEVAAMRAVADAFGCALDGKTLARWCQRIENEILDAPCGIMDQMTSALGTE